MNNQYLMVKQGMTTIFMDGIMVPVTVLRYIATNYSVENQKLYYDAVALKKMNKPQIIEQEKMGFDVNYRHSLSTMTPNLEVKEGDKIRISALQKGLGLRGTIDLYNFSRQGASHGHDWQRKGRSIGNRHSPGRVLAGRRAPGRRVRQVTVYAKICRITEEHIFVKGSVPGNNEKFVFCSKFSKWQ
jgi:ribosomal protein L3